MIQLKRNSSVIIYVDSYDSATIHMYPAVDWAVPADPYILEELGKYEGWHTAKNLEINTEFSRQ